jgi:hypothetical protein
MVAAYSSAIMSHVLIVDDERDLAELLEFNCATSSAPHVPLWRQRAVLATALWTPAHVSCNPFVTEGP